MSKEDEIIKKLRETNHLLRILIAIQPGYDALTVKTLQQEMEEEFEHEWYEVEKND